MNKKTSWNQILPQKSNQRKNKYMGRCPKKMHEDLRKDDYGGTQKYETNNKIDIHTQGFVSYRRYGHILCNEKKEEESSSGFDDCVDATIQSLDESTKKRREGTWVIW